MIIKKASENIFKDLDFSEGKATELKRESDLFILLKKALEEMAKDLKQRKG